MELTKAVFVPLIGESFEIPHPESGEVYTRLTLKSVSDLGRPHPGRAEPFSMIFEGPKAFAIGQGVFTFRHPVLGEQMIFIVPVGESGDSRQYESIFN